MGQPWFLGIQEDALYGMPLVVTHPSPTYRSDAVIVPGTMVARVERRKKSKYSHLSNMYKCIPIAIETLGVIWVNSFDTGSDEYF